jgi:outer membrane protein assembly factor BamD
MKRNLPLVVVIVLLLVLAACFRAKKGEVITPTGSAEPDKILYEKGLKDLEKGRFEIARLTLQTLLNTYPDSDYKEKAKMAIADSFYKQGGTSGLVQAEAEYKDFMTFFPTSDDSDDAQMRVAMTHYRQMEKPDRDRTQAKAAEREFKNMLEQFPDSPLRDEAIQRLREVQEVLGEGDMRVAQHYMRFKRYDASVNRSMSVLKDYPDFSQQDGILFIMGQALEKKKQVVRAGYYYGKIVSDHPLSSYSDESRKRLEELNLPIPEVNPEALARAQAEKDQREKNSLMGRVANLFSKKPDVSSARKSTRPPLDLGPERVNLDVANAKTETPTPPPITAADASGSVAVEIVNRSASPTNETSLAPAGAPGSGSAPQGPVDSAANKPVASQNTEEVTTSSKEAAPTKEGANNVAREDEKGDKNKKKKSGLRKIFRF